METISFEQTLDLLGVKFKYNDKPIVIMLMGIPGSGKTTFRHQLLEKYPELDFKTLSTDDILDIRAETLKISYEEAFNTYSDAALENFNTSIKAYSYDKKNCVIDRTNTLIRKRIDILDRFENYYKIGIVINTPVEECHKRVKQRFLDIGKNIPEDVINNMDQRFNQPVNEEFDTIIYTK